MDTRPGLVHSRARARIHALEKKHEETRPLPTHELEARRRDEALSRSHLEPANVGFALMLKMGYRSGAPLGKSDESSALACGSQRLVEPIPITMRSNRRGLGDGATKQPQSAKRLKQSEGEADGEQAYLDMKRSSFRLRQLIHSLHKCQRICFQLDSTKSVLFFLYVCSCLIEGLSLNFEILVKYMKEINIGILILYVCTIMRNLFGTSLEHKCEILCIVFAKSFV